MNKYKQYIERKKNEIYLSTNNLKSHNKIVIMNMISKFQETAFQVFFAESTVQEWAAFALNPVCLYRIEFDDFEINLSDFSYQAGVNSKAMNDWKTNEIWVQHKDFKKKLQNGINYVIKLLNSAKKIMGTWVKEKNIDFSDKNLWEEHEIPPEFRFRIQQEDNDDEENIGMLHYECIYPKIFKYLC